LVVLMVRYRCNKAFWKMPDFQHGSANLPLSSSAIIS
jgi:hypothetical protein